MTENSMAIHFHDFGEDQEGFFAVRRIGDKVALCLSLERNGDVEALLDKEAVIKFIHSLTDAIKIE